MSVEPLVFFSAADVGVWKVKWPLLFRALFSKSGADERRASGQTASSRSTQSLFTRTAASFFAAVLSHPSFLLLPVGTGSSGSLRRSHLASIARLFISLHLFFFFALQLHRCSCPLFILSLWVTLSFPTPLNPQPASCRFNLHSLSVCACHSFPSPRLFLAFIMSLFFCKG